jgi:hypothetical protein
VRTPGFKTLQKTERILIMSQFIFRKLVIFDDWAARAKPGRPEHADYQGRNRPVP